MGSLTINASISKPDPSTYSFTLTYNLVFVKGFPDRRYTDHKVTIYIWAKGKQIVNKTITASGAGTIHAEQIKVELSDQTDLEYAVTINASISTKYLAAEAIEGIMDEVWAPEFIMAEEVALDPEKFKNPSIASNSTLTAEINGTNKLRIGIVKAYTACSHTITIEFGTKTKVITTSGTVYEYVVPMSWISEIPNATTGVLKVKLQAIKNKKEVGAAVYKYGALGVPKDIIPSAGILELIRHDENVPPEWDIYVQANSKVQAILSGYSGVYSSTIKEIVIKANDVAYQNEEIIGPFMTAGMIKVQGYVVDSRNRKSEVLEQTFEVKEYSVPIIMNEQALRYKDGTESDEGIEIRTKADYTYSEMDGKNSVTTKILIRQMDEETDTDEGEWSSGIDKILETVASAESRYRVAFCVSDRINTIEKILIVETAKVLMDFKAGGKGLSIGKVAEYDNLFDVGMDTTFRENVTFTVNGQEYTIAEIIAKLGMG